ncbi:hypothetical protein BJ508DRAFT_376040 [Ascobolus immersus RN42]|uniref:DDE-1 domain-containing protein n=1 Tax=Ascobolus immersus RN42 TaxID=1160509 RepID=A0A3N4I729_ASCIM|nr:hypothetical protein BJ508DRAFT_376040 [Ascobolus immersus RN42]
MERYFKPINEEEWRKQRQGDMERWRETRDQEKETAKVLRELSAYRKREATRERVRRHRHKVKQRKLAMEKASVEKVSTTPSATGKMDEELGLGKGGGMQGPSHTEVVQTVNTINEPVSLPDPSESMTDVIPAGATSIKWVNGHQVCDFSHEGPTYIPSSDDEMEERPTNDIRPLLAYDADNTTPQESLDRSDDSDDPYDPLPEPEDEKQRRRLAEASRPWRRLLNGPQAKKKPCGRKRTTPYQEASRINWFNALLWDQIHGAMVKCQFKPTSAVNFLQKTNPETFRFLHHYTVSRWMERENGVRQPRWSQLTLRKISEGRVKTFNNRAGILDQCPDVKEKIIVQLRAIRATGCRITVVGAQAIIISFVSWLAPHLLDEERYQWKVSDRWTRNFLRNSLGWTIRKGTTAAQKLPADWQRDAIRVVCRMAYLLRMLGIPDCFVLNMDETGILLQPGGTFTYHDIGATEVPITGAEDKRQFTLICTISMSGELLPFGALWPGTTERALPKPVPGDNYYYIAQQQGHKHFNAGDKHWSTVITMMRWVEEIVMPYRHKILADFPQYIGKPMILYIDVYWCHRCDEFLTWLDESAPRFGCRFIVLFVPANTTSVCQPCDVGLQRPIKHELRRQHMATAILETSAQLVAGIEPSSVKLDVSLPHLRNQSPGWLSRTFDIIRKTDAVKHSWARSCKTGIFDLSFQTVTSDKVWDYIMNDLQHTDPEFRKVLFSDRSLETVRPVLDGKRVIVEALEPSAAGGPILPPETQFIQFGSTDGIEYDGTEVHTEHLIQLILNASGHRGLEKIPNGLTTQFGHVTSRHIWPLCGPLMLLLPDTFFSSKLEPAVTVTAPPVCLVRYHSASRFDWGSSQEVDNLSSYGTNRR